MGLFDYSFYRYVISSLPIFCIVPVSPILVISFNWPVTKFVQFPVFKLKPLCFLMLVSLIGLLEYVIYKNSDRLTLCVISICQYNVIGVMQYQIAWSSLLVFLIG